MEKSSGFSRPCQGEVNMCFNQPGGDSDSQYGTTCHGAQIMLRHLTELDGLVFSNGKSLHQKAKAVVCGKRLGDWPRILVPRERGASLSAIFCTLVSDSVAATTETALFPATHPRTRHCGFLQHSSNEKPVRPSTLAAWTLIPAVGGQNALRVYMSCQGNECVMTVLPCLCSLGRIRLSFLVLLVSESYCLWQTVPFLLAAGTFV
ncbi:hypothetical protein TGMAS_254915 [Toxoplasma gondii MAS]|uniref:Uncharacterized protein n=2 Tax=Toxoplasma gondii TaxID=5811 RepID=A0A086QR89_TOXGO|nr:hypothetical protein TGMAS_254915 [Toxoplasma gondii MAS]PUA88924.1 hypothetical protein TGBR9_254915 [Toxoplasma gondii TgCATBr9]